MQPQDTRRAGLTAWDWDVLHTGQLKRMEAAVLFPHGKPAPSLQNILAKLYRDKQNAAAISASALAALSLQPQKFLC